MPAKVSEKSMTHALMDVGGGKDYLIGTWCG